MTASQSENTDILLEIPRRDTNGWVLIDILQLEGVANFTTSIRTFLKTTAMCRREHAALLYIRSPNNFQV